MLSTFSGLELRSGDQKADAVLVGIIYSPDKLRDSRRSNSLRSAKSALGGVVGDERGDFYIPATTQLTAGLRLVLIKNPGEKELELLKTSLGKFAVGPRIIVNETIGLSGGFTRELYGANAVDVIDSQNRSALNSAVEDMAEAAARNFKDMILYAF